jgi:hypothetical protein
LHKFIAAIALAASSSFAVAGTQTYFDHCLGDYVSYTTDTSAPRVSYFDHAIGCQIDTNGNCAS